MVEEETGRRCVREAHHHVDRRVLVGVKGKIGEFLVSDKSGVWKTRAVKRKPVEELWMSEGVGMIL